jgi:hypothetical protein
MVEFMQTNEAAEVKSYKVPMIAVDPLMEKLGIIRNDLFEVIDIPDDADTTNYTDNWWKGLDGDKQREVRELLQAVASPQQLTRIKSLRNDDFLMSTIFVQDSSSPDDPGYLIGETEERRYLEAQKLLEADVMNSTLLLYLDAGFEAGEIELQFTVPAESFPVFMALLDLYRRSYMISVLEHSEKPTSLKVQDVLNALNDGIETPDLRWNVPFIRPILAEPIKSDLETVRNGLYYLATLDLIEVTDDYSEITLNEPMELIVEEFVTKHTSVALQSLSFYNGQPVSSSTAFIRTTNFVWFIDITGGDDDSVLFAATTLEKAGELLAEIFTPTGLAPMVVPEGAASSGDTPMCPKCGKPATWVEAYKRWYCYTCQEYLDV